MKRIIFVFLSILSIFSYANAKDFFLNITDQIAENEFRLSYGVSVTDVNKDNKYEFVVTGFGFKNLALSYKDGKLINIVNENIFLHNHLDRYHMRQHQLFFFLHL